MSTSFKTPRLAHALAEELGGVEEFGRLMGQKAKESLADCDSREALRWGRFLAGIFRSADQVGLDSQLGTMTEEELRQVVISAAVEAIESRSEVGRQLALAVAENFPEFVASHSPRRIAEVPSNHDTQG